MRNSVPRRTVLTKKLKNSVTDSKSHKFHDFKYGSCLWEIIHYSGRIHLLKLTRGDVIKMWLFNRPDGRLLVSKNFWPGEQLRTNCIRFRQKKFRKNIGYRKQGVENKNVLTCKNIKKRKKITIFIFNIDMIPIFWGRFSCFPIFSIINISGFINLSLNYLTWLGLVWQFLGVQVCVLLDPAVSIVNGRLNSGG